MDLQNKIKAIRNNLIEILEYDEINNKKSFSESYKPIKVADAKSFHLERMIDHTILKSDTSISDIKRICEEAIKYNFYSICIPSFYVPIASDILKGRGVHICTVVGFPLGNCTSKAKAFEASEAINNGASEVDMVMNIGLLKNKKYNEVKNDIEEVVKAVNGRGIVKVIIETCLLLEEQIIEASLISQFAGADFVKTSTGFSKSGANPLDVKLIKTVVGDKMGVKASGGIKSLADTIKLVEAGASRVGTSSSISIINEVYESKYI